MSIWVVSKSLKNCQAKKCFIVCWQVKKNIGEEYEDVYKDTLSGLRKVLAAEIPLKMMEDAFLFHLKVPFHSLHIKFFVLTFGHVEKQIY